MRCKATTKAGTPCRAPATSDGAGFCYHHSPDREEQRARTRSLGGKARWRQLLATQKPTPAGGILELLAQSLEQLQDRSIGPDQVNRLRALGYLCSVALKACEVATVSEELEELKLQVQQIKEARSFIQ